jgi:hypothetical protein
MRFYIDRRSWRRNGRLVKERKKRSRCFSYYQFVERQAWEHMCGLKKLIDVRELLHPIKLHHRPQHFGPAVNRNGNAVPVSSSWRRGKKRSLSLSLTTFPLRKTSEKGSGRRRNVGPSSIIARKWFHEMGLVHL